MELNKKETFNIFPPPLSLPPPLPSPGICFFWVYSCSPTSLCLLLIHSRAFVWFPWAYSPNSHAVSANCFVPPLLQSKCHILFKCLSSWRVAGCVCVRVVTIQRYLMLRLNLSSLQNLNSIPTKALGFLGVCLLLLVVDASFDLE